MKNPAQAHAKILKQLRQVEAEMMKQKSRLAKLRKALPLLEVKDYELHDSSGKETSLSRLFGKKKELILVHNMGTSCPYCTLWADGFNGMLQHLENRAAFAVESPDSPKVQGRFRKSRGWKFQMVSSAGTLFRKDSGFETREGDPQPGVTVFVKDAKGKLFRASSSYFGPGDNFCSLWDLFDLLPKGSDDWQARLKY
jgi:predicted dithiol-disulfide oxidoreductase (DUF899 family)